MDFLVARPDVDSAQIVLYGISQAGYWVPRAVAFERRIAAAIADPGVFNAFEAWCNNVPPELQQLLDSGDKQTFDRFFNTGILQAPPAQRQNWEWRASRMVCGLPSNVPPKTTTNFWRVLPESPRI